MKNQANENVLKINVKVTIKSTVVENQFIKCSRPRYVSIIPQKGLFLSFFDLFQYHLNRILEGAEYARQCQFFHQKLGKIAVSSITFGKNFLVLWSSFDVNKQCELLLFERKIKSTKKAVIKIVFYLTNKIVKLVEWVAFRLISLSGDVEVNPGPVKARAPTLEVITYNIRGLKEYNKLKRVLNKCAQIIGKNRNTIINLQETHLEKSDEQKIRVMWRGSFVMSPGSQKSRGCLTLLDPSWEELERWEDPGGRVCLLTIKKSFGIYTLSNIYAPNQHEIQFFEDVILKQVEQRDKHNSINIIVGDHNLCLDEKVDSVHRKQTDNEKIVVEFIIDSFRAVNLCDVYRKKHDTGGFTWNRGKCFSRLDLIVASEELADRIKSIDVDWAFDKSDHAAIIAKFEIKDYQRGPGLPRVDTGFLNNEGFKREFTLRLNECIESIPDSWDPHKKWEFIKVTIRSIAWDITSKFKKSEEAEYKAVCNQLNSLKTNKAKGNMSPEVELNLDKDIAFFEKVLHVKLEEKSKDLAYKAKVKWFNEGEKSNKYFLNLMNKRQKESMITKLTDGVNTASGQKEIESLVVDFYSDLYKENSELNQDFDFFYDPDTPALSESESRDLDMPITLEELKKTLRTCKESAPGPDGIPYLLYKSFWEVLGPFSLGCWNYSFSVGTLPESQRNSSITLLPKEGKDLSNIANWRPITLTNCDLKIYTKLISNRLSKVLNKIIHTSQTAYIPGRNVHDNLRMFEFYRKYCEDNNIDAVLMSMDAKKAFDSVDHSYMFRTLRRYGFSDSFIETIKLLYKDIKADILVNGFRTTLIRIARCVKQGDALSCGMFIICIDPLLRNINRNRLIMEIRIITPLSNIPLKNKTGAFADDVGTLVMNNRASINGVFEEYKKFSSRSGIMINESKTEILELKPYRNCFVTRSFNIDIGRRSLQLSSVEKIKICGVTFSHNRDVAYKDNVSEKLEKLKGKLLSWQFRGLSLGGKITIVKTFGVSQLIYTMQSCSYAERDLKETEAFIFKFLWSRNCNVSLAPDRISRNKLKQDYDLGGLRITDLVDLDQALKLKQFIRANSSNHPIKDIQKWQLESLDYDNPLQQEYARFSGCDGVTLKAQECINRITDIMRKEIELNGNPPYKVDLLASTDVLEYIKRKKLPLIQNWYMRLFRVGIENLKQLIAEAMYPRSDLFGNLAGNVLTIFPQTWIHVIKENWECESGIELDLNMSLNKDKPVACRSISVAMIRERILLRDHSTPKFVSKYGVQIRGTNNPFLTARKVNHATSLKIFKYRLLHGDIFCNERMFKFKMVDSPNCKRCGRVETVKHVLWECVRAKKLWNLFNSILFSLGYANKVDFDSIFVGFIRTELVIESVITRLTQILLNIERETDIEDIVLCRMLVSFISINIDCLYKIGNYDLLAEWIRLRERVKEIIIQDLN